MDIAQDEEIEKIIGYCTSSISDELFGEVDSIYPDEKYRSFGICDELMKRALDWMGEKGVKNRRIIVAVGNEELLQFYEKYGFFPRHIILEQK